MLTVLCESYAAESAPGYGCVSCVIVAWDWLWVTWKDLCCVYELVEGVSVTGLLLCNQYFM